MKEKNLSPFSARAFIDATYISFFFARAKKKKKKRNRKR